MARGPQAKDFTIGWICALPVELTAAKAMLDEVYECSSDYAQYTLGRIGIHSIVIICLPAGQIGTGSAAAAAVEMQSRFPALQMGLMVGIGGGVPNQEKEVDIRLGDVVISQPRGGYGGVVQYDFGKTGSDGLRTRTGFLNAPPAVLLTAVANLQSSISVGKSNVCHNFSALTHLPGFTRGNAGLDTLFESSYTHVGGLTCDKCCKDRVIERERRKNDEEIVIHCGTIASGNQVIKDAITRDRLSSEIGGTLCFEMEAAGVMNVFPCLVIRGICDYADSHKNKRWQPFAAAAAAACAKEILSFVPAVRQSYLNSLMFDQLEDRHDTIKAAHDSTCKWLLSRCEYQDWLDACKLSEHHGFFWIKGKPATGKSTIMKFAYACAKENMRDVIVISFFFNARGEELEKSAVGMYRSLLFQLLESLSDLRVVFDMLQAPFNENIHWWETAALKRLFKNAILKLRKYSLACFIDALDECEEDQVRDIVSFFEDLGQLTAKSGHRFYVCFSSRHYPHITLKKGIQLVLEKQQGHEEDIIKYVHSELRAGQSGLVSQIKSDIIKRSSGIFLWVVLVVQILNKEYDHGRIHTLRRRLDELPNGLDELFQNIMTRDSGNMEELILCLQWILYAKRPLKCEELYFAILAGIEPVALAAWEPREITRDDMGRFILSSSKGLAEVTKSKDETVQFIHESVRDFLLKENGLSKLRSNLICNLAGLSHDRLKQCCQSYIDASQPGQPPTQPLASVSFQGPMDIQPRTSGIFSFLGYAVQNILYHSDIANLHGVEQDAFIKEFPLGIWINLKNPFACRERRYTSEASMLYILAVENLPNLVRIALGRVSHMDITGEHYGSPIHAALACGNENVVKALLLPMSQFKSASAVASHDSNYPPCTIYQEEISYLLNNRQDISRKYETLLWQATRLGRLSLMKVLLATEKIHINSPNDIRATPLSWAAKRGRCAEVKLLIEHGANIEPTDRSGQTPLSLASLYGHEALVKLLIDNGSNTESRDSSGLTPLSWAIRQGHETVVKLLAEHGADLESRSLFGQTPLFWAVWQGHEMVVKLLIDLDVDMKSKDCSGRTPLSWAVMKGYENIAMLLRRKAAENSVTLMDIT
jgi:ankyrin repeat protein/nucleoside phosphorylase